MRKVLATQKEQGLNLGLRTKLFLCPVGFGCSLDLRPLHYEGDRRKLHWLPLQNLDLNTDEAGQVLSKYYPARR